MSAQAIRLLTEPINTREVPGFFLCGTQQAIDIVLDTRSHRVALQYDIYFRVEHLASG